MSKFDHKAARARCDAATDGPWTARRDTSEPRKEWREIDAGRKRVVGGDWYERHRLGETETHCGVFLSEQNADFIAHARTDLPAALDLLDEVERLARDADHHVTHAGLTPKEGRDNAVAALRAILALLEDR